LSINLEDVNASLNEVVVIGYGQQKKLNVIGSVETVGPKEIMAAPVGAVSNALAGRLPGLTVQQPQGEPGADEAILQIRGVGTLGNSSPLIIIDGIEGRNMNSLNANDIESISVLKDASAAIYGARAANGVILITTKRGRSGKSVVNYNFYTGLSTPTWLPKMTDAATYATMVREMQKYDGVAEANLRYTLADIEKYRSGEFPWTHPNTDWNKISLKKFSKTSNHNLSINGGTEAVTYYASLGYFNAGGLYKNDASDFSRYNVKLNVSAKLNKYLTVGLDLNAFQENRMSSPVTRENIFNLINQSRPTDYGFFPNGSLATGSFGIGNHPTRIASLDNGFNDRIAFKSNNIINASLKIPGIKGLTLSSYYAYDIDINKAKFFTKSVTGNTFNRAAYLAAGNTGKEDGSAFITPTTQGSVALTDSYGDAKRKLFNAKLDYVTSIKEVHNLSAFVAYESFESTGAGITASRTGFNSDALPYLFAGPNTNKDNSSFVNTDARINFFGRISYDYKEKYLVQFAMRRDGSLRFSRESGRWGTFPSVLAGWIISKEDFWKIKAVNFLKIKASWAKMGNDQIAPFQYLASYSFSTGGVFGAARTYNNGLLQNVTPNPFITWEVANATNLGFESMFFGNKLFLNVDVFNNRRSEILIRRNASVPDFSGISLPSENYGIVDNKGFEVELGYKNQKGKFSYGLSGNLAYARSKIVEFDEPAQNVPWQVRTGHPIGATLLHEAIGIFRDVDQINKTPHVTGAIPGDVIIRDVNNDGKIDANDRVLFDKAGFPEITYGVNLSIGYKAFELTALATGVGTTWRQMLGSQQGLSGNYYQFQADGRWTPDNPNATKPRTPNGWLPYWRSNSFRTDMEYQDMEFARLKNLQISYTLPQKLRDAVKIKNAQIYLSGQNLFLIYASQGIWDPEFSGNRDNYPIMRVFTIGANVTF
jgi:TonB-linked SusC/RagA family outer membrane protein